MLEWTGSFRWGVVASAIVSRWGWRSGDPIIGLAISLVILRITWQSWRTVSRSDPGEMIEAHEHSH
jgi:Co/Zn/Cd efflux system component